MLDEDQELNSRAYMRVFSALFTSSNRRQIVNIVFRVVGHRSSTFYNVKNAIGFDNGGNPKPISAGATPPQPVISTSSLSSFYPHCRRLKRQRRLLASMLFAIDKE